MATHQIEVTWGIPDSSNQQVYWEKDANYKPTNDRFDNWVLTFDDPTGREGHGFHFLVPQNYVGSAAFKVDYMTDQATANVFRAEIDYRAIADGESYDPSTDQENLVQSITVPATQAQRDVASIGSPTAGNFAAGDRVQGTLFRDHESGTDTVVGKVGVYALIFEYADA